MQRIPTFTSLSAIPVSSKDNVTFFNNLSNQGIMKNFIINIKTLTVYSLTLLMINVNFGQQVIPRLDELVLKGTHNSYACCGHYHFIGG
jgi:hypothetical protein